ncbi:hypothetical protein ACVFI8_06215 [Agarivorans sp. MS3-6]
MSNVTDFVNIELFPDAKDKQNLTELFRSASRSFELKQVFRNINNAYSEPSVDLCYLLRSLAPRELEGVFAIMRLFNQQKGLNRILNEEYMNSLYL